MARRPFSLRRGVLSIAGRKVARDVVQAKRVYDRRKNRDLILAVIAWDTEELRSKYGSRNVLGFTLTGRRVWQIQEPDDGPREERYFVGLGGSSFRPAATISSGWVYDINASDGSIWYLKWVK